MARLRGQLLLGFRACSTEEAKKTSSSLNADFEDIMDNIGYTPLPAAFGVKGGDRAVLRDPRFDGPVRYRDVREEDLTDLVKRIKEFGPGSSGSTDKNFA